MVKFSDKTSRLLTAGVNSLPVKGFCLCRALSVRSLWWLILPVVSFLIVSCDTNIVFEKNHNLDPQEWNHSEVIVFEHHFADTVSLYDMFINVRNTTDYQYSNLFLFFQATFPDGTAYRDTIEVELADRHGKWKGRGFGNLKSNSFHFRREVWFPQEGDYLFTIQHAMRHEYLSGISDIGLRIERIQTK